MIKATGIKKSFGNLRVLHGIDMELKKSEIVSIVGPSGSGKTTLLQILGTLDKADSGTVIIDGQEISYLSEKKIALLRNQKIGFIFQFHQLLPEFTALENVVIPALIGGESKAQATKRAKEIIEYLGLSERETHKPAELSGGEKQRIAVARALINKPSVILADEPSGSLDTASREELHNLFFKLREDLGQTFLIVTHDETLAAKADRRIQLKDGLMI